MGRLDNRCLELMGMTSFYDNYISLCKEMEEIKTELKKERQKGLSQEEEINKMKMELINITQTGIYNLKVKIINILLFLCKHEHVLVTILYIIMIMYMYMYHV